MRLTIHFWFLMLAASLFVFANPGPILAVQDQMLENNQNEHPELADQLQNDFWLILDRNGKIREKSPLLGKKIQQLTCDWIGKLSESDLALLTSSDRSKEAEKKARELEKNFRSDAKDLVTHFQLADKLATKVIETHWKGMEKLNVTPESVPEYTSQYNETVLNWFHARTIEDLSIFEKPRPKPNERERGEKITAELLKTIEQVQQKYQSHWKIDDR